MMRVLACAMVLATAAAACGDDEDDNDDGTNNPPAQKTITAIAAGDARFSMLVSALQSTGLDATLDGAGPFTVFAPTNEAFARLPEGVLASLDAATLRTILQYHVIAGQEVKASMITDGAKPTTVEGSTLQLNRDGQTVVVNGLTQVTVADIDAKNGVIHAVDSLLLPKVVPFPGNAVQAVSAFPRLQTLRDAVVAADLAGTLSTTANLTIFAPTNTAFAAVPSADLAALLEPANKPALQELLQYHVAGSSLSAAAITSAANANGLGKATVPTLIGTRVKATLVDGGIDVNDATVAFADVATSNAVIHVIDKVLTVPGDIVAVAQAAGFSALLDAATANNLATTLQSDNDGNGFTVFAPTNEAFAALGLESYDGLTSVLLYHVLSGQVDANAVVTTATSGTPTVDTLTTASPGTLALSIVGGNVVINGSVQVTTTDVIAKNGIVHVIDAVLLPET